MKGPRVILAILAAAAMLGGCSVHVKNLRQQVDEPRGGWAVGPVAIVYSDDYIVRLGGLEQFHPFPISKYDRAYRRLVDDGLIHPGEVFVPTPLTDEQALRVHTSEYWDELHTPDGVARVIGVPRFVAAGKGNVQHLLDPFKASSGGTIMAARLALKHGIAFNLGGGYNHARSDTGAGFGPIADVAIAIRQIQADGFTGRVLIVDLDVHQGDGPARDFPPQQEQVAVFDMFEEDLYPPRNEPEHYPVPLSAGIGDSVYLDILARRLPVAIEEVRPGIIFLVAGTDVHRSDRLGRLSLTTEGIVRRDLLVVHEARKRSIPVAIVTGGGYSQASWQCIYGTAAALLQQYGDRYIAPWPPKRTKAIVDKTTAAGKGKIAG